MGEQFRQLVFLLKHTFTIVGRDRDILGPLIRMALYAAAVVTSLYGAVVAFGVGAGGKGMLLMLLCIGLFLYKFIYYNRHELMMSWLVFETAAGRDRSVADARAAVKPLRRQIWMLGFIDMFAAWIAGRRSDSEQSGPLVSTVLAGLVEVWDLANHFLLPTYAVDKVGCREGFSRLKTVKDHVPETLMGIFGIDIMGRVVGVVMFPVHIGGFLFGILLGLWFGDAMPAGLSAGTLGQLFQHGSAYPTWMPFGPDTVFNWLPVFTAIWLTKLAGSISARLVTGVKVIYFTLFYARVVHPDALTPEIRDELEAYLTFNEAPPAPAGAANTAANVEV